jgi:hypothetical protein
MADGLAQAKAALAGANTFEAGVEKKAPAAPHEFANAPYKMAHVQTMKKARTTGEDVAAGLEWRKKQGEAVKDVVPKE